MAPGNMTAERDVSKLLRLLRLLPAMPLKEDLYGSFVISYSSRNVTSRRIGRCGRPDLLPEICARLASAAYVKLDLRALA